MPRRNKNKRLKNRSRRSRPINDVNHNNTNITVQFKKVLPLNLVPSPGGTNTTFRAVRLAPSIAQITQDLGTIYKLYRFTSVRFTFQADITQNLSQQVAINYIPAQEAIAGAPTSFDEFEGPAVGFYANSRGAPYTYNTPTKVLNAMPYNWYETKAGEASDLTQGVYYFLCDVPDATIINVYCHFTAEFQTLEDPAFLSSLTPVSARFAKITAPPTRGRITTRPKRRRDVCEEDDVVYERAESIYCDLKGSQGL